MKKLLARLPDRQGILHVYATAVFMVYGWTLYTSFWKVPSWLFYLTLGEVLSIYSYAFVINFLESLLLVFPLLLLGVVLPARWWNHHFTPYGMAWVVCIAGSAMLRLYNLREPSMWEDFLHGQWLWWGLTVLLAIALSFFLSRIGWLRKGIEGLADRLVIFLYIYLPLTALSFVVLLARALG
ncbi:MAG: hypothetical protein ACOYYU_05705 [Chloroflexota bacterium]